MVLGLSTRWDGEGLWGRGMVGVTRQGIDELMCLLLEGLKRRRSEGVLTGEGEVFRGLLEVPSEYALAEGVDGVSDLNAVIGGSVGDRGGVGGTNRSGQLQGLPLLEGA